MARVVPVGGEQQVVWGVTPSFLRDLYENLIQKHPAWNEDMTSGNVVYEIIKPLTAERALSYIDQAEADSEKTHRKPATTFVSHAWKNSFSELMSALLETKQEVVYWLDLIFINQHVSGPSMIEDIERALVTNVTGTGTTLIVCHPWNDPVCIKRSWCTFEIYLTLTKESKLKVALSSRERAELERCLQDTGSFSDVRGALMGMDVMEAEAQDDADRDKIKERITAIGPPAVNQMLRSAMAEAYVELMPVTYERSIIFYRGCVTLLGTIPLFVFAVIGPCSMVYRLCVVQAVVTTLSRLIPFVLLLSRMGKLIHAIASAGVGSWRALGLARHKLASAIRRVSIQAMQGSLTGMGSLYTTGLVAISQHGCRQMCNVVWLIVALMALEAVVSLLVEFQEWRNKSSISKGYKVADEESGEDEDDSSRRQGLIFFMKQKITDEMMVTDEESGATAEESGARRQRRVTLSSAVTIYLDTLDRLLRTPYFRIFTNCAFVLIVGLIAWLHPDIQCANPDFVWQPDAS